MTRVRRLFLVFTILLGIFHGGCCENYSVNPLNFQLNKKAEFESPRISKENIFEIPLRKNINGRRRLLLNEENGNTDLNAEWEDNNEYSDKRSNTSESESEKMSDRGKVRFQIPLNSGNFRNSADVSARRSFFGIKTSNLGTDYDKKSDVFEESQPRWNEEKNFEEFSHQDLRAKNHYKGRFGEVINDNEMNKENRRADIFDRRVSITTLSDAEAGNMKNYDDNRVANTHSNMNYHNRNLNSFWDPTFFKPEKGVVINLKTECSTPRQFNNQLVHKFIFAPKTPVSTHSEYSGFQIPGPGFISSHKMTPMYYL